MNISRIRLIPATLVLAAAAFCQTDRAAITGTLRDASGALLGDARLTVTYPDSGLRRSVLSNGSGAYLVAGLPLGRVLIQAEKPAFRSVQTETVLGVGETKTLDFALVVASVDTSIQVVAEADLVRNSAAYGSTLQNQQISQLPINGRNWQNLMTLVPGAVDTGAGNGASVRFFARGGDDPKNGGQSFV